MRFLAPLGFLFAAALPVIVLFYLLKLKRVRRDVSSTMLWRRAAEDVQANAPFQKLRRNLLLFLQLLVAALIVFGLARPFLNLRAGNARNTVIMVDNSASMGAKDAEGGRTRLEAAKDLALRTVRDMAPGDQAMVIAFADKAAVLAQFTGDRTRLEQVVRDIPQTDLPTQPGEAFSLAQSLAKPLGAQLALFSDGCFPTQGLQVAAATKVRYAVVGRTGANAGIVALDLRRPPENMQAFEVFATVRNYGAEPVAGRLEVRNNGKVVDVREVAVAAGAESAQVFTSTQLAEGRVELRLDAPDGFDADNRAYAVIAPPRKRRLVIVTAGNYFLDRVLREDRAHTFDMEKVAPAQFAMTTPADLYIFDNFAPPGPLPPGNYFFINAMPPVDGYTALGEEADPVVFDWDTQHPAMRYAELGDVQIARARKFALPGASQVLAESRETPLVSIYSAANRNVLLWSFDIFESNLPLRAAFPIMLSNAFDWLLRGAAAAESSTVPTGTVLQIEAPPDFKRARIADPAGQEWQLVPGAGGRILFDRTARTGFYHAEIEAAAETARDFGVSLASAAESDIAPRVSLSLPGGEVKSTGGETRINREVWRWFALAALAFILLEWLVYHRRVWV